MLPVPQKPSGGSDKEDDTLGSPLDKEKSQSAPQIILKNSRNIQSNDDLDIPLPDNANSPFSGARLKQYSSTPGLFTMDQDRNPRQKAFGPSKKSLSKISFNHGLQFPSNKTKQQASSYKSNIPAPPQLFYGDLGGALSPPSHLGTSSLFSRRKTQPFIPQSIFDAHNTEKKQEEELNENIAKISDLIKELQNHPVCRGCYICEKSGISPDDTIHFNSIGHETNENENDHTDSSCHCDCQNVSDSSITEPTDKPIKKLYHLLSKSSIISKLPPEVMANISELLKENMEVSIVDEIPRKFICSDQIVPLKLTNLDEYQYVLRLFILLLCKASSDFIKDNFINQPFAHQLFEFYDSPSPEERRLIEDIFAMITEKYKEFNKYIYFECFTRIAIHLSDQNAFYCIQPALTYLNRFLKANSTTCISCHNSEIHTDTHYSILKSKDITNDLNEIDITSAIPNKSVNFIDIFTKYILSLFSSNFLSEFYTQLSQLCSFFYGIFEEQAPTLALQYLLSHWPETNSQKQSLFMNQIGSILQSINSKSLEKFAESIINKFSIGLKNENFRVVVAIVNILNNESYITHFAPFSKSLIHRVLPSLLHLKTFWFSDIKNKLTNVIERFKVMDNDAYQEIIQSTNDNSETHKEDTEIKASWELIASKASQIDGSISLDKFHNHLENMDSLT